MLCSCPSFTVFGNTSPGSALQVAMSKSDLFLVESVSEVGRGADRASDVLGNRLS